MMAQVLSGVGRSVSADDVDIAITVAIKYTIPVIVNHDADKSAQ